MEGSDGAAKAPSLIQPLPRDSRGSLEVFNPTTSFSAAATAAPATKPKYTPSYPVWHSAGAGLAPAGGEEEKQHSKARDAAAVAEGEEVATPWMAIKGKVPVHDGGGVGKKAAATGDVPLAGEVGAAAQRAAEWGLVLRTDEETGKPQGVGVRKSGEDANRASRRNSGKYN